MNSVSGTAFTSVIVSYRTRLLPPVLEPPTRGGRALSLHGQAGSSGKAISEHSNSGGGEETGGGTYPCSAKL